MSEGTLLDQWRLALAGACDPRLSRGDVAILIVIEDRFYKSKGNSRASFDLLADKAGINRRNTIRSLQRLTSLGYLKVLNTGRRGRATEYLPNFKLGCAPEKLHNRSEKYGVADDTLTDEKSGVADDTLNGEYGVANDTLNAEYDVAHDTPTYLREPADKPGGRVSRTSDEEGARGAAPPPPLGAASGAVADTPRDPTVGFDELWAAWPSKHQRPKAKEAYKKLNPDGTTHAQLVAAAQAWAEHYQSNGVDKRWIPLLHNWLQGERWLEDVPAAYEDPKSAAIANKRGRKSKAEGSGKEKEPDRASDFYEKPEKLYSAINSALEAGRIEKAYDYIKTWKHEFYDLCARLGNKERLEKLEKLWEDKKPSWLMAQIDNGVLTPEAVDDLIGQYMSPIDIIEVAEGKQTMARQHWEKLYKFVLEAA